MSDRANVAEAIIALLVAMKKGHSDYTWEEKEGMEALRRLSNVASWTFADLIDRIEALEERIGSMEERISSLERS